jgi:arabinogalactan oligomer/maltooligosaccharide transport system permease protein
MYSRHTLIGSMVRHALLLLAVAFALFPFLWVLSASFNVTDGMQMQRLIPPNPTLAHYKDLFTSPQYKFGIWLWNSVKISLITSAFVVALTALAAYSFSRFRFKGRRVGLLGLLLVQMFPQMLAIVALYVLLLTMGDFFPFAGMNTHTGLIMIYLGGAMGFNTWLMKGYFDTIPRSLEESAKVDGATPFQAFVRIILPLVRPILATIFVLTFISVYSDFMIASIVLRTAEQQTIPVGLRVLISDNYGNRWALFAAGAVISALPFLAVFLVAQRSLVSGLTRGGVKE